ncbi:MAG TPA: decarboxylating 6-phosphogluconate dehydrogenase [Candidatus Acidoferrales bacterium]|nr:decarboxylating 6-phosphogluconate dehydrogenase [Candidatus Acidoferrales bacterium]
MQVGFIGLGRMGSAMVERLLKHKHKVVAYDRTAEKVRAVAALGAQGAHSLGGLIGQLNPPRVVWLMVPAGDPVAGVLRQLEGHLQKGDVVIDGGNSYYRHSIARANDLKKDSIHYLDAGTSGGVWGRERGYCLMVGGDPKAFKQAEPLFKALAPKDGYAYVGPSGAGHFAKMVHNGIEYSMLQAYGEGFEMLERSEFGLDLHRLARLWNRGSVVRSWLLELAESALQKDRHLRRIRGYVEDSGEGRWTVQDAVDRGVAVPTIAQSLFARFQSRQKESFANKLIAALRKEFGGHTVKKR